MQKFGELNFVTGLKSIFGVNLPSFSHELCLYIMRFRKPHRRLVQGLNHGCQDQIRIRRNEASSSNRKGSTASQGRPSNRKGSTASQGRPSNRKGLTASQGRPIFCGSDNLPKTGPRSPDNSAEEPTKWLKLDSDLDSESVGPSSLTYFDPASLRRWTKPGKVQNTFKKYLLLLRC